ncbi:MAG: SH3 domain-containing protein [Microcoleaceae cyanobacterium]
MTTDNLNVRSGPGTNYAVTFVLRRGDVVGITRRDGNWAFVVGERGGEGWVDARYLSSSGNSSPSPNPESTSDVFKGQGTIDNARYNGSGDASLVIVRENNGASVMLSNPGQFSIEYIGRVRSNFEGTIQVQVEQFRSSEMGYRTVPAAGDCDIQVSSDNIRRIFCTVTGNGIDHGRSNFNAR